jgi:hypothetical protein
VAVAPGCRGAGRFQVSVVPVRLPPAPIAVMVALSSTPPRLSVTVASLTTPWESLVAVSVYVMVSPGRTSVPDAGSEVLVNV